MNENQNSKNVDEKDYWTDEDLRDLTIACFNHFDKENKVAERLSKIAALPIEGKTDKFSGRDHDRILYGEDRKK